MKCHHSHEFLWKAGLGFAAALLLAVAQPGSATPVIDGDRDAEYTLVASSPKDNLFIGVDADNNPINDNTDPRAKLFDAKDLYAANTGTDLYLYIELPYYDLNAVEGEWAIAFHLKGANDAIAYASSKDPFGAEVYYNHLPGPNVVLKSNALGYHQDYDGNQGWAALVVANKAMTGWAWPVQQFLTNGGITKDTTNGVMIGTGSTGGMVAYKNAKGIELKIPFSLFGNGSSETDVKPPRPGDDIQLQFYDNMRDRTGITYPRGPVDAIPHETAMYDAAAFGYLTQYATYKLKAPPELELGAVSLKGNADLNHVVLSFSSEPDAAATTTSNYTVVNQKTGAMIPVASAAIDATDPLKVILEFTIPYNAPTRVTVANVKAANGDPLSTTKNSAVLPAYTAFQMNLHDPWGAISSRVDPTTGSPYKITLTGDINGWASDDQGSVEFPVDPVTGEPGHYRTPILLYKAGVMGYKYRMPGLGNWDNWNAMNPHDQHYMIPASDTLFQANNDAADNIGNPTHNGGPLSVTFILKDLDDISKGRPVYITGDMWGGWSDDPTVAQPMELQPGLPHTYKATFDLPAPYGIGNTTQYKYIIKPDTGGTLWDDLNPFGNRWVLFSGTGTPATQTILDIAGGNRMMRILRTAAGLDPAPGWYGDYTDQDADLSGSVTVMDALKATRP